MSRISLRRLLKIDQIPSVAIVLAMPVLLAGIAAAQDKYSLQSPSGIAFSDFRGYGTGRWSLPPGPTKCSR
jgi:hypothetical protein